MYNLEEQLTPHFQLKEFLHNELIENLPASVYANIKYKLAPGLEEIRKELGDRPIHITSGYRSLEHQIEVYKEMLGSSFDMSKVPVSSYHLKGLAADFQVDGMTPRQVQAKLVNFQHGLELCDNHTHVDFRGYRARFYGEG